MDLFIPYITVQPVSTVNDSIETKPDYNTTAVSQNSEFQKIYFEELARKYYEEDGNFNAISNIARIHYEEYYGGGSTPLKRWKIYFSKYKILHKILIHSILYFHKKTLRFAYLKAIILAISGLPGSLFGSIFTSTLI